MLLGLAQVEVAAEVKAGVNEGLVGMKRNICWEESCALITTQNQKERCLVRFGPRTSSN